MWDESLGTYKVWPGEGSHGDFGPRGWKQRALAAYVESQIGYCETEHVRDTHMTAFLHRVGQQVHRPILQV